MVLDGCQNDPDLPAIKSTTGFFQGYDNTMTFNGETLHVLPAGHYDSTDVDSRHYSWNGPFNYDSVATLVLDVWPIYELYDTLRLDLSDMHGYHEDDNDTRYLTTAHGCDSLMHIYVLTCGDTIQDADNNTYYSRFVGRYCWTKQNLYPTHYTNGDSIPNSMIYYSLEHPDEDANLDQYGRLYSWYSAVNVPENSTDAPYANEYGFVQGLCPTGWHIPSARNMNSLRQFDASALKSTNLWLQPGNNSTLFTAYPAGIYNPAADRFENLLGETRYWTTQSVGDTSANAGMLLYSCDQEVTEAQTKSHGFSVRCVKDQPKNL